MAFKNRCTTAELPTVRIYYLEDEYSVECQANLKHQVDKHPTADMELKSEFQNKNMGLKANYVVEAMTVDGKTGWQLKEF